MADQKTITVRLIRSMIGRPETQRAVLRGMADAAMKAAERVETGPIDLPGPTGESNRLTLLPR